MDPITVDPAIFRAYDIRGIVDKTLTYEITSLIGKAIGSKLQELSGKQILVARDGRTSGALLLKGLCEGLLAAGCDVVNLGMVPTPLLYFATQFFPERSGIMLTGSHNPSNYNGMKIVLNGKALTETEITDLYIRIQNQDFVTGEGKYREKDFVAQYIEAIKADIHLKRQIKIVIDAGNGVTGKIAPQLFKALGCEVVDLFCEVDGTFPHHHPDPSQLENLQDLIKKVKTEKADLGLAFDGDGDRLGVVTNKGKVIFADRLLMLFAIGVLAEHPEAKIIYDVKCTHHLDPLILAHRGIPIMWKTGHSLIKIKMAEIQAKLGGEMSGHFFFKDRWNGFDDALYAGARLLEILSQQHQSSEDIFSFIPNSVNTPELKVLVGDKEKFSLMQALIDKASFQEAKEVMTIDGLRVHFEEGWGLIRPSNTSPYLILRFEAMNEKILNKIQLLFRTWMLSVKPDLVLPF